MAPGGQSTFQDDDGKYYITYHQRFDDGTEYHEPRVHQMYTNEDGWFVAAPFATMGETLSERGTKIGCIRYILCSKPWNRYQQ